MIENWSGDQVEAFDRDGFLIVEKGFVDDDAIERLRAGFDRLFAGDYDRGIRPDEVNWVASRDPEDRTRQICNGWKADPVIDARVLAENTGHLAAELMRWEGVRMLHDNCIWKPPGTKSLGMHQDGSYLDYLVPPEMVTCWIALDDTSAEAGTITYAPGGQDPRLVPVKVKAGGASFHHHLTFHGSGPNTALIHAAPSSLISSRQTRSSIP